MRPALPNALFLLSLSACGVEPQPGAGGPAVATQGPTHGSVLGEVRDASGAPVAGVWVTAEPGGHETRTLSDGSFSLDHLPEGEVTLWARIPGGPPSSVGAAVEAGGQGTVDLVLAAPPAAGPRLQVQVVGPDGAALGGVQLLDGDTLLGETDTGGAIDVVGAPGAEVVLTLEDGHGRVAGADLPLGALPAAAGVQWSVGLSGRAPADARVLGSAACGACHPDAYAGWAETAHAHAQATDPGAAARGAFVAGEAVDLGGGATATPLVDGDTLRVRLVGADGGTRTVAVAGWIGWPARAAVPTTAAGGRLWPLPIAWRAGDPERPGYPGVGPGLVAWRAGRWVDGAGVVGEPAPPESAEAACLGCHATGFTRTVGAGGDVSMRASRGEGRAVEDAVGCERCHGPGGDHRRQAADDPAWHITNPGRLDADRADAVCGQCHGTLADTAHGLPAPGGSPDGFQPGDRLADFAESTGERWPGGAAAQAPMEWEEHTASAHGAAGLRCVDCHGGHGGASGDTLQPARDNTLCETCHLGLDFGGDDAAMEAHMAHVLVDPAGLTQGGRCTGCHMPGTATTIGWDAWSGAGDAMSHGFVALPPADTLAAFDAEGAQSLPLGAFPAHACGDCHAWNAWRFGESGVEFPGPDGEPTLRATHAEHDGAFSELYP